MIYSDFNTTPLHLTCELIKINKRASGRTRFLVHQKIARFAPKIGGWVVVRAYENTSSFTRIELKVKNGYWHKLEVSNSTPTKMAAR